MHFNLSNQTEKGTEDSVKILHPVTTSLGDRLSHSPPLQSQPVKILYLIMSCSLSLMLLGKLSKMEMAFQTTKVGISWLLTFICWCPDFTLDVHQCPDGRLFVPSESKKWFFIDNNGCLSFL